ncbi:MAG: metallophosphoesterase family protein [Actinomycetota bacterium]
MKEASKSRLAILAAILAVVASACSGGDAPTPAVSSPPGDAAGTPAISPPPAGSTRLVVVGDFGMGNGDERDVASAIHQQGTFDALVTTGDNVYPDGSAEHLQEDWTDPYGWVQDAGIPVIASLGNHDRETDGGAQVANALGMPADWYVERVGPVDVIVLDVGQLTDPDQTAFLHEALTSSAAPWQVVVFHEPVYSCSKHGSTPEVQTAWLATLRDDGADLVLNGHDHAYQRFAPPGGPTYVVTGGGGAPLYEIHDCWANTPQPVVSASVFNFLRIDATPSSLDVTAVEVPGGGTIDRFTLSS